MVQVQELEYVRLLEIADAARKLVKDLQVATNQSDLHMSTDYTHGRLFVAVWAYDAERNKRSTEVTSAQEVRR